MMELIKKILYYILLVLGTILILVTLLSLFYSTSLWFLQILNFPRLLVLISLTACLILFLFLVSNWKTFTILYTICLLATIFIQAYILYPYTPLASKEIASADLKLVQKNAVFSIIVANVLMKNRHADALLKIIREKNPTFILTMEVNSWWVQQLDVLTKDYPYTIKSPNDHTYGMVLYSKIPLNNTQIHKLNHENVPSFSSKVTLPNGAVFELFTIHPVAPFPSKHPTNANQKEVALLKAGEIIAKDSLPSVVAGDFNDVGWSHNTQQFQKISSLNDVRYGRGMYSTFDAKIPVLRWPLDYVFTSKQFKVLDIERLPYFGSDHFPYYVQLTLEN